LWTALPVIGEIKRDMRIHLLMQCSLIVIFPLSSLIASGQIERGDQVVVDCLAHAESLAFSKIRAVQPTAACASA